MKCLLTALCSSSKLLVLLGKFKIRKGVGFCELVEVVEQGRTDACHHHKLGLVFDQL